MAAAKDSPKDKAKGDRAKLRTPMALSQGQLVMCRAVNLVLGFRYGRRQGLRWAKRTDVVESSVCLNKRGAFKAGITGKKMCVTST